MRAVIFHAPGEPLDVLRVAEVPVPRPADGEALVAVSARPIHPADHAFIRGRYRVQPILPQVAGLEGVGRVVACGSPGGPAVGTRVAFRWPGAWAEHATVPVDRLLPIPDDIDDATACQMSLNPLTAWGLLELSGVGPRDWLILTAATSTVANLVARLCRARGIRTIGIVRGEISDASSRASADLLVSSDDPDLTAKITSATGSPGASALLDSVGGPLLAALFPTLRNGARILAYGVQDPSPAQVSNATLIYGNLTWYGFGIDRWLASLDEAQRNRVVDGLWASIRDGSLPLPVVGIFDLADFREALRCDSSPGRVGKVLLA